MQWKDVFSAEVIFWDLYVFNVGQGGFEVMGKMSEVFPEGCLICEILSWIW